MTLRPAGARRRTALLGLPVTGVLLLGGCGLAPSPPRPAADPAPGRTAPAADGPVTGEPATACPPSGVRIRAMGTSAAMGLRAMGVELVNCGSDPYPLRGYPVLRLFDADGKPITVRVVEGRRASPRASTTRPAR
ncbi:DUF4232 domain-containing protein [Micromonospora sp. NPDC049799]|uniref:DUF4232 domain-containing protein n=1 Tax=Micromonospora sp. NPDC049799 TaxID=3154741 RepID=UPI0033DCC17E